MISKKTISERKLKKQLQTILAESPNTIKSCVVQESFDYGTIKGLLHSRF